MVPNMLVLQFVPGSPDFWDFSTGLFPCQWKENVYQTPDFINTIL